MADMIYLERSDHASFKFGDLFDILTIEGAGILGMEIFSEKRASGNGDIVTGQRIPARTITIKSVCINKVLNDTSRRVANSFFNSNFTYKMYINYKGSDLWIGCTIDTFDLPTNNIYAPQELNLILYCEDPLFKSVNEFGKDIASVAPKFGFPLMSSIENGFITGVYNFERNVFVDNNGSEATYPRAKILAHGEVVNFTLSKNKDEFVKVLTPLHSNDVLVMDFAQGSVTLNNININRLLDRRSIFFTIDVGGSTISYSADTGENVVNVSIYYNQRYSGV